MKNNKWRAILIVIAVLAAAVAVLAYINAGNLKEKQERQSAAAVRVVAGSHEAVLDLAYLKTYEKKKFNANLDENSKDPVEKNFGGVPLITVLTDKGFDISGARKVVFKAADGYTTVVTPDEAKDSDNVYLVYERDGKPSGTRQQGGSGPIEIVIRKDQFSQRWCKYLMEIEIQ